MKKIPFKYLPASWGLKGKARARAEAEYYFQGIELEYRLAEIQGETDFDRESLKLGISHKHHKLTEFEYQEQLIDLGHKHARISEQDMLISKLDLNLKHQRISQTHHEKELARIRKEPWVNVVRMGIDTENPAAGYFELDWNEHFVEFLQQAGYLGINDEEVVNKWFNNVCSTVLLQAQADQDYGMQQGSQGVQSRELR